MGAVSGLADIPEPDAAKLLRDAIEYLPERNQKLAREGLLKMMQRFKSRR
jgi:hypothetical protein